MVQKKQNNMMSKILYKYPDKRRSQKTKASLVTDTGLKKNELYTDFVQHLTKKGKKAKAEKLFRKTLHIVEQKTKNPLLFTVLEKAVKNVEPSFFLKKARLGGASQQIPAALDKKKKKSASIRFLIQSAVDKQKKVHRRESHLPVTFAHFLAIELHEASQGVGSALQKRDEIHKLAESNRVLLTQRWW